MPPVPSSSLSVDLARLEPDLIDPIERDGFAVVDTLFDPALLDELAQRLDILQHSGLLQPAATGRGERHGVASGLRGDCTRWLDGDDPASAEARFLAALDTLRIALNRRLMLGLHEVEAHFAHYAPGAGYVLHRDRFRDDDARVLSLVCYLNRDWQTQHGGALRAQVRGEIRQIWPRFGTVVLFLSADIEHEVLPAARARRSIAAWFRQRPR